MIKGLQNESMLLKTFLPLLPWLLQKACGPAFSRREWKSIAQSHVPPPNNVTVVVGREFAEFDTPALLSSSYRRRLRKLSQHILGNHLRDNSSLTAVRQVLIRWRRPASPLLVRKLREIEAETDEDYEKPFCEKPPPKELSRLIRENPDTLNLLWEFAKYGEGGTKPGLRRDSKVWSIFNINPEELLVMPVERAVDLVLSRFVALLGLDGPPPDEPNLRQLLRWVIRTHLPSEREPETTPEAVSKAVMDGLIHKPIVISDKETGEEISDAIDPYSTCFVSELEDQDEASTKLDRLTSQVQLTEVEHIIFVGLRRGLEGEALTKYAHAHHIGKTSVPVIKSRLMEKLRQVKH